MSIELAYGEVSAIDYLSCRIRVRLDDRDGIQTFWLNIPQRNTQGTKRRPLMPELGEQVAVLLDADGVGGVYLGGIYSTAEPPPVVDEGTDFVRFSDGTVSSYDRKAGVMRLECVGALVVKCGRDFTVEADESLVIKAPSATLEILQVTLRGSLQVNGDITATGSVMDAGGNSNHHSH
ncbi:phage baseplate assembly protein V [Pseudomonas sp. SWRI102]|uniref:Phage baseplate assembly protein V n=1 Tax=Pseudomonas marvdashtae TaxID=2745500 RepID=A0A923JN88_9PSED|nr:phage baseplate assembly protein V [Pseudomonas marvdashtae]MBV4551700.1 phage baseplate assembly protein V [Pseudomonas marvdashtae]